MDSSRSGLTAYDDMTTNFKKLWCPYSTCLSRKHGSRTHHDKYINDSLNYQYNIAYQHFLASTSPIPRSDIKKNISWCQLLLSVCSSLRNQLLPATQTEHTNHVRSGASKGDKVASWWPLFLTVPRPHSAGQSRTILFPPPSGARLSLSASRSLSPKVGASGTWYCAPSNFSMPSWQLSIFLASSGAAKMN